MSDYEVVSIVIDNGSSIIKAGFSSDNTPSVFFTPFSGRQNRFKASF